MKPSALGFTAQAVALAATFGLSLTGPHRALAAPAVPIAQNDSSPAVTILSPVPRTSFTGLKPVEISAFYQGAPGNQIVTLELFVDGIKAAQKTLDNPETRGVVSFLIDASALTEGTHHIVVRATAADADIASAKSSFIFTVPAAPPSGFATPGAGLGAPRLSIQDPSVSGQVQGKVKIHLKAEDPSGKAPYVSLFIDRTFKTLRNYAPYEFEWDTTEYSNGYHTIDAFGYNDAQDVGHAQSVRVLVNNPGGQTQRRTDLQDAPKTDVKLHGIKGNVTAKVPTKPVSAKARLIARRPTPAMLAQAKPTTSVKRVLPKATKIARVPSLPAQHAMALTGMPGLADPFIKVVTPVRPQPVVPLRGFKPLMRPPLGEALMAIAPTTTAGQPHLLRAKVGPPAVALASPLLVTPHLPVVKASIHTALPAHQAAAPTMRPMLRASLPHLPHLNAILSHAPTIRPVVPRTPRAAMHLDWLRAAGQKSLMFNSTRLPLERPLTAEGSVLFGPLRQIFQSGGGSLMWQARTGVVTARNKDKNIQMTIGQKTAVVNQTPVIMDGVPYINQGRTMIPLSFLKAAMNVNVQYDSASGHLLITSKD